MFIYIFLFFLLLVTILVIIVKYTIIYIEIYNFRVSINNGFSRIIGKDYKIIIKLYLFKKFNYKKFCLTEEKIGKIKNKNNFKKLETKFKEKNIKFNLRKLKNIKQLKLDLNKLELQINLGFTDAANTAIIAGGVSSIIAIFLSKITNNNKSLFWKVIPVYKDRNIFNMTLNCTIQLRLINIFYSIYLLTSNIKKDKRECNQ